jgi:gluconokinase
MWQFYLPIIVSANMNIPNIVVMGVAGCGKSSLGQALAAALSSVYIEGDSFHPPENIARMAAGTPLTDADRAGWLTVLANQLAGGKAQGQGVVLACSALKQRYRDTLRHGDPQLLFVHLAGSKPLIAGRMATRSAHFMPTSLLDSQFADLEAPHPSSENVITLDISQPLPDLLQQVLQHISQRTS